MLLLLLASTVSANFISDPVCPPATPLSPGQCVGQKSTCWSPGVRDTDCPGHGLCCYDGCANTCVTSRAPQPSIQEPVYHPPPVVPPPQEYLPLPPPTPAPYVPPPPPPTPAPYVPPPPPAPVVYEPAPIEYLPPPTPAPYVPPPAPLVSSPSHPSPTLTCPAPAPSYSCEGRTSTCWSPGVPDLDCPDWALCCFDGCANTCLGATPPPPPPPRTTPRPPPPPRNPCEPSPCHHTAMCIPQEGLAMCKCRRGLEGDRPEPHPLIQCREPDPCSPSPCGTIYPGTTTCTPDTQGNPVCRCLPGLLPKPDTIAGCGPECLVDPDCRYGFICSQQRCVERPDPCQPNPCGPGAVPLQQGASCTCECPTGTVGDPYTACHRGECIVDDDCSLATACRRHQCVDPCLDTCASAHFCRVMVHRAICGFNEEATPPPREDTFVIGERYTPPEAPSPSSPVVVGERYAPSGEAVQCAGAAGCTEPRAMMMMMDTSGLPVIGLSRSRRRQTVRRRRQRNKL